MKILFYGTKNYDEEFFEKLLPSYPGITIKFTEANIHTIEEIVANNPKSVEDYKAGKKKAIGFLVGQTMKATQGKANPGIVNKILTEILDNM